MTDQQIEKALECCAQSNTDCDNCPYHVPDTACVTDLQINALVYINRLKAENSTLQEWKRRQWICNETNRERIMQLEDEKEALVKETDENTALAMKQKILADEINKETVGQILQDIFDVYKKEIMCGTPTVGEKIKELARVYRVAIEEGDK